MIKTTTEILDSILYRLMSRSEVTHVNPGTIARTFSEVIAEEMGRVYEEIGLKEAMGFLSTSTGRYIDLIGELFNCPRELDESDDNYKARISKQVLVVAGANETAIRLAALSVEGVYDVKLKEYSNGAGSFSLFVVTDNEEDLPQILNNVELKIKNTKGFGIYPDIRGPEFIDVDLGIRLIYSEKASAPEKATIKNNVIYQINNYIKQLGVEEPLIINELIEQIMSVDNKIKDFEFYTFKVNGQDYFTQNIIAGWDEKITPNLIEVV